MKRTFKVSSFVFSFLKKHIGLTILLLISVLGAALSGLLPPFMLRYLIDDFITVYVASKSVEVNKLILVSLLYFLSYFLVGIFTVLEDYLISLFGQKMIHELRYEMIRKSHRLKAGYFTRHGTGEMSSQVMDDVYAIETLFASGLFSILVSLIKILGILVSIFTFSWMLGLIILAMVPLIYLVTHAFRKAMLKAHLKNRKYINAQSNSLSESIQNINTIQNLDKEDYREEDYVSWLEKSYHERNKTAIFDAIYSPIIEMMKTLLIALITLLVFYGTNQNQDSLMLGLSIGTYAASLTLISNLFSPIQNIRQELETMQEGISGLKRVETFLNEEEIKEKDSTYTASLLFAKPKEDFLSIQDLTFRYEDGDKDIFSHTSFVIHEKEKVTLVGRTGVGKTTLFKLILGLETPTQGKILLNGYDVSLIPDQEKRKIFGYVEQGFQSIYGSVKDQITLYDESYSLEDVRKVMDEVGLDEYVMNHIPNNYNAPFKESDFSRGQLQLLSLARALLSDPKILLLDEISANLDSKTEQDLIAALSRASNRKTVLSISHRLSDQLGFDKTIEIKSVENPH